MPYSAALRRANNVACNEWIDVMMNKKLLLSPCALSLLLVLSGCASVNKAATELWNWDIRGNQVSNQPVTSRAAPLVVPPDFALSPAQVPTARSQQDSQEQTLDTLFGGPAERSASEQALSNSTTSYEPGIRSSVGDGETKTINKGSVTRDIIAAPEGDGQSAQAAIPG